MEGSDESLSFILKFEYKQKPHILEVRPLIQQYKICFKVTVAEHEITFEEDEEGQLRAVADANAHNGKPVDHQLLEEIARRIQEAVGGTE